MLSGVARDVADSAQRGVNLVRDTGDEHAQRRHFLVEHQLTLGVLQLLVFLPQLGRSVLNLLLQVFAVVVLQRALRLIEIVRHALQGPRQLAQLDLPAVVQLHLIVTGGDRLGCLHHPPYRL